MRLRHYDGSNQSLALLEFARQIGFGFLLVQMVKNLPAMQET